MIYSVGNSFGNYAVHRAARVGFGREVNSPFTREGEKICETEITDKTSNTKVPVAIHRLENSKPRSNPDASYTTEKYFVYPKEQGIKNELGYMEMYPQDDIPNVGIILSYLKGVGKTLTQTAIERSLELDKKGELTLESGLLSDGEIKSNQNKKLEYERATRKGQHSRGTFSRLGFEIPQDVRAEMGIIKDDDLIPMRLTKETIQNKALPSLGNKTWAERIKESPILS